MAEYYFEIFIYYYCARQRKNDDIDLTVAYAFSKLFFCINYIKVMVFNVCSK